MKKLIIVCVLLSALVLSSCNVSESKDNISDLKQSNDIFENNNFDEEQIEVEKFSTITDNIDELLDEIKMIKQGKKDDRNNAASLDSLIVPNFTIEGYYLAMIELTDKRIFYYFSPLAVDKKEFSVSMNRDYVVTVCRSEYVNKNNPLQPLMDQLKRQPDENGYLRGYFNEVIFVYDSVWVSIRPPRGLKEFGDLTKLCKMKTIKIA